MYPHDFEDTINIAHEHKQMAAQRSRVRRSITSMTPGFTLVLCVVLVALCAVVALSMPH